MDLLSLWRILQVVLGIGLVIFVHELGHYLAARICKVRVLTFSLGMGPKLFSWKRGDTEYQIAAVPLGGYVRMAGEETHYSDSPAAEHELGSKTVGQRFFIYSAGVIMNVVFGLVVFPLLLMTGIPSRMPVVGAVPPGSPAWQAGIEPGMRILEVNGESIYDMSQIFTEVAHGGAGPVRLQVRWEDSEEPFEVLIDPDYDDVMGIYSIGNLGPAWAEGMPLSVEPGGAAANIGVLDGDELLGVVGAPPGLTPAQELFYAAGSRESFDLRVKRGGIEQVFAGLEPKIVPGEVPRIGITALVQHLSAVRDTDLVHATGLLVGDRLLAVDGMPLTDSGDLHAALTRAEGPIRWEIRRNGELLDFDSHPLKLEEAVQLAKELALVPDIESSRVRVVLDSPAYQAGLRTGDWIEEIDQAEVKTFEDLVLASRAAGSSMSSMALAIRREGSTPGNPDFLTVNVTPQPYDQHTFGLALSWATYDYKVSNPVEAVGEGALASFKMIRDVFRFLRGMMRREVGKQHVGSIIKISVIAHDTAEAGWVRFFWFLCLLSMNLAFLNVLPIPILDGGHLFFLIIEKIKGSPVSETLFSYSQLVGLVLIVSLFVFAIYNDLTTYLF
jgi:regulator of sigma E protease